MLGGGNNPDLSKRVLISTVQSAYNRVNKKNAEFLEWTGNVVGLLLDEAHHGASRTWYTLADSIFSEYTLGFSAEPFYGDADNVVRDMLLRGTLGSILYRIPLKVLINRGYLSHPYVFAFRSLYGGNIQRVSNWQTVYKAGIVQNTLRNAMIVEISDYLININKAPLILVQQVQHGRDLAMEISKHGHKVAVLTGGQMVAVFHHGNLVDEYFDPEEKSKEDFKNGVIQGLVGTSVLDEGVDMPSIASVILAGGGKSKLKLIQRIGRGLRPKEIDNTTFIIDFQDAFNKMTGNHFKQRKEQFDKNQFDTFFVQDMAAFNYLVSQVKKGQDKTR
jgi:superfamily II DNA or RNA helicase